MATMASFIVPTINNEPNKHYAKGSPDRAKLGAALEALKKKAPLEVPLVVGGQEIKSSTILSQPNPSSHAQSIAKYSNATSSNVKDAISSALAAKSSWESLPFADRAAVFLKAADLISGKYRYEIMAATMLGQGKNAWQAEIDAAAELCDFLRFNVKYAEEVYSNQPVHNSAGVWNRVEYRPLEGFVYAISPFNFTAIGGNLPCAPALMGNVVIWKPSPSAIASNYLIYNILIEAGLPPSVIQFVPGDADEVTSTVLAHPSFASLHFTGSTSVFRSLYGKIAEGVTAGTYTSYPRIVAETGGKNFHLVHRSADVANAAAHTVRGAFEYQGQKCSAASRAYVPASIWPTFREQLVRATESLKIGDPAADWANFVGPVIHDRSFAKLRKVIDDAKSDSELTLLTGGKYSDEKGYFIHPTIYETKSPTHPIMSTELFGPVLAVYVYDDSDASSSSSESGTVIDESYRKITALINSTSTYSLTGAIFAKDRPAIRFAEDALRNAAGNFYINCKCTGAVVGQQPFGGARASGTNDKAGSAGHLARFVSARAVKEEFVALEEGAVEYVSNEV
ncbi:MAG: 1-pyrroline-5-carboxylate dehydrogenase [Chaenotheca gracillima]|nr:MAG: 1-pyrroline-5-carboxylate dehydrogenase [Chaenotheca gracillima]